MIVMSYVIVIEIEMRPTKSYLLWLVAVAVACGFVLVVGWPMTMANGGQCQWPWSAVYSSAAWLLDLDSG